MKLNNKGLTLVELIVAFAILVMFLFGMLEIVLTVKSKAADEMFSRDLITYKETLIKTIEDDLIKKVLVSATCTSNTTCTFEFGNGSSSTLVVSTAQKTIEYNGVKYEIPNAERIYFGTVNLDVDQVSSVPSFNKVLVLDIPYYEVETATPNYGIKIVHPMSK